MMRDVLPQGDALRKGIDSSKRHQGDFMSMLHYFQFFDREAFDSVWSLSWREFERKHGSRWSKRKSYEPGEYDGASLRGLICFSLDPEPSPEFVEEVLQRRTVRWTIRHSCPQFCFMTEIMQHVPGYRASTCCIVSHDVGVLISVATGAYIAGKIDSRTLRAVLKLCGSDPEEWVQLSRTQKQKLAAATADIAYWKPIYTWQGNGACISDESTSCSNVPDTRRFLICMMRALSENWPLMTLKVSSDAGSHFRDLPIAQELRKAIAGIQRFKRPSAYREWS